MEKTDVIILAAGNLKNRLKFIKFISDSPALIPINTRSVLSLILDFYRKYITKINNIWIVINEDDFSDIKNELIYYLNENYIHLIPVKDTLSANYSLSIALNKLIEKNLVISDVIVNIVTTVPTRFPEKNSFLISEDIHKTKEYSLYYRGSYLYKGNKINRGYAFSGIFRVDIYKILKVIDEVKLKNDLLYTVEKIGDLKPLKMKWIDVGHEVNYYNAKNQIISSRSFNKIDVISGEGIIIKRSTNSEKLAKEVDFIKMLPESLKIYFPRILDFHNSTVKMEYYGYPTLAEYMLYWDLDLVYWDKIFSQLKNIFLQFRKYKYSIGFNAYVNFYFKRIKERYEEFKYQMCKRFPFLFDREITINNRTYINFESLQNFILERISQLYNESDFNIMHGDFCFNNILYDIYSQTIRLIDVRGSFGENCVGIYGDIKYDLAKLMHSTVGKYDYIANNLFSVKVDVINNKINYKILERENFSCLSELTKDLILNLGFNYEDIYFLMGLLFIGMTPLHFDDWKRQVTLYVHGIKILNDCLRGVKK